MPRLPLKDVVPPVSATVTVVPAVILVGKLAGSGCCGGPCGWLERTKPPLPLSSVVICPTTTPPMLTLSVSSGVVP